MKSKWVDENWIESCDVSLVKGWAKNKQRRINDRKIAWRGWNYLVQTNSRYPKINKKIWSKINEISLERVWLLQSQIKIKSTSSSRNVRYVERIGSWKLLIGISFQWRNRNPGHPTNDDWEETLSFLFHTDFRSKLLPSTEEKRSLMLLPSRNRSVSSILLLPTEQEHSYRYNHRALHQRIGSASCLDEMPKWA